MDYESEKLIKEINKRNTDILKLEKKSFEDFQEYKKNQIILNKLNKRREFQKKNYVEKEKNSYLVVFINILSILFFIFSLVILINYKEKKEDVFVKSNDDVLLIDEEKFENVINNEVYLDKGEEMNIDETEIVNIKKEILPVKKTIIVSTELRGDKLGYFYSFENNNLVKEGRISAGREHYETPVGKFKVLQKKRYATSKTYPSPDGTNNMDFMIRLTWGGIALHMGNPNQISHGCVHIDPADAEWLFNWTDYNTDVYLTTKKIDKKNDLEENIKIIKEWNEIVNEKRSEHKIEIEYWPNGKNKSIKRYLGKYLHGVQTDYWENGFIKEEKFYKTGRWSGKRITYWENGMKHEEFIWKNDELQMGKSWDKNGKLLFDFDIRKKN